MVTRVSRAGRAGRDRPVRTPVVPRDVVYSDVRAASHSRSTPLREPGRVGSH
jgi:hypothetical protein